MNQEIVGKSENQVKELLDAKEYVSVSVVWSAVLI